MDPPVQLHHKCFQPQLTQTKTAVERIFLEHGHSSFCLSNFIETHAHETTYYNPKDAHYSCIRVQSTWECGLEAVDEITLLLEK